MRDVVVARREIVTLDGTFGEWSPITVHLDGEISIRDRSNVFKGTMFAVFPGDIVFSKIDARSGAIGMLPGSIAKAIVTPEFPVFVADPNKLDSGFVQRVLRTGGFLKDLRSKATGTSGRKRISPEAFLELRVPLPVLAEQRKIVTAFEAALKVATAKEQAAETAELKAIADFEIALGFGPSSPLPDRPVFVASFKDLDRWSHDGVLRQVTGSASGNTSWPVVRLDDVIADLENGWSPKCLKRPAEANEWGVLKLGAVSFGIYNEAENKALPSHLKPRPDLEVRTGEVLISRANVSRLVGATALIQKTRLKLLLCDKIFRIVWREETLVTPEFTLGARLSLDKPRFQGAHPCRRSTHRPRPLRQPRALRLRAANGDRSSPVLRPRTFHCAGRYALPSLGLMARYWNS